MALQLETLKKLIRASIIAKPVELGCYECLDQIHQYAERVLASKELPEALKLVEEHLEICGECREEYEALLTALRSLVHRHSDQ